mmetsp:Transcript_63735/g.137072  ORF Transcript_63735/g.137072 Transcript_63735/m.137072 type:complete len:211 (+) Transcript_63735:500-1132(+)
MTTRSHHKLLAEICGAREEAGRSFRRSLLAVQQHPIGCLTETEEAAHGLGHVRAGHKHGPAHEAASACSVAPGPVCGLAPKRHCCFLLRPKPAHTRVAEGITWLIPGQDGHSGQGMLWQHRANYGLQYGTRVLQGLGGAVRVAGNLLHDCLSMAEDSIHEPLCEDLAVHVEVAHLCLLEDEVCDHTWREPVELEYLRGVDLRRSQLLIPQ